MDDSSDILGGQLNIAKHGSSYSLFSLSFTNPLVLFGAAIVATLAYNRFYPSYKQYQEKRYRKRHGIPDSDHRPFNVAYAAAKQARERESGERSRSRMSSSTPQVASSAVPQRVAASFGQNKQRLGVAGARSVPHDCDQRIYDAGADSRQRDGQGPSHEGPAGTTSRQPNHADSRQPSVHSARGNETDPYLYASEPILPGHFIETPSTGIVSAVADGREAHVDKPRALPSSSSLYQPAFARAAPLTRNESPILGLPVRAKRVLDTNGDAAYESKRWHAEDGEMDDDIDQTMEWRESDDDMEVDRIAPAASKDKRGAKRVASLGEESFDSGRVNRGKRARRSRRDADDEDVVHSRGKKRDRGSSSDQEESPADEEDEKPHRHRRRRVVSHHKKASEGSRGRKRGRDPESMDSDEESDSSSRRAGRYKRGKKASSWNEDGDDEGMISNDPLCKGRRIGEVWEVNGVHYKVGPNGQRLRQAFVKKTRSRFPMPQDSEHPDAMAHIDVFVESWLTEEEYQTAKDKQELSWQQSPTRRSSPVETAASEVPDTPTKGKNLLWESTAPRDMVPRKGLTQTMTTTNGLRVNPIQSVPNRRISTLQSASPQEGPKMLRHSRSYSKWEKQDLEAAAMAKLREKVKQETTPAPAPSKATASTILVSAPSTSAATTNGSKPAEASGASTSAAKSPFSLGAPSGASAGKSGTSTITIPTLPTTTSTEPTKPSTVPFPSAPASTSSEPARGAAPNFFSKPSAAPAVSTAPSSAGSSSVPNFFAKPAATAPSLTPTTNGSASNLFGTAGDKTAAPASQSAKPAFSWGAPPASTANKAEEKPAQAPSTGASSLLSRLGPQVPAAPSSTAAASGTAPSPTAPLFSFAKPSVPSSAATAAATPAGASSEAAAPKFSFGMSSKPAGSAPTMNEPAAAAPKSAFGFGVPQPAATNPTPAVAEPPKFSFGVAGGSSSGTVAPTMGLATPPKDMAATNKPMFSFASATPQGESKTSLFGNTTTPAGPPKSFSFNTTTPAGEPPKATSLFGNASTPVAESKTASVFSNTTTPAGEPKIASVFGNTTTPMGHPPQTSLFGAGATTPKAPPLFGNTTTPFGQPKGALFSNTAAPSSQPPQPTSVFGNTTTPAGEPKVASVFGNTGAPAGETKPVSVFGNTSTPAGEPPKTSIFDAPGVVTKTPLFGNTSAPAEAAKPNPAFGGAKSSFSFGTTGGSAFGQPAANAPGTSSQATQPAKSAFPFGTAGAAPAASTDASKAGEQPKPSFSFGGGGAFGATNGTTGGNPFGAFSSTTPAAAPGAGSSAIAPGSGAFGSTSALGAGSVFGSKPAGTQPTTGGFSFGPSGGSTFSFGKTNTDSTQK
ncbi:hypothetical protein EIP86_004025 [Pleurotus ostreatoroseus]|nr:hypothetical protein EIP86_004025 [Pleurotus ostreatoroseus]